MRVLFVIDSLSPGGTETSTVLIAPLLRSLGINFSIVVLKSADNDLTEQAREAGIPVHMVHAHRAYSQVRAVRRLIQAERPDLVHSALFYADQIGRIATALLDTTVVTSFVNTPYVRERFRDPNIRHWKLRTAQLLDLTTAWAFVDHVHAVSEGVKSENCRALRFPSDRVSVVERGRDSSVLGNPSLQRRRSVRRALEIPDDLPVLLNVGRQEYQKGQIDLIQTSRTLAMRGREHVVLIAGKSGNASADLTSALSKPSGPKASVRLLGHRDDIGDLICAADLVTVSSIYEGTAGAALEAMALGTPVVSTDLAGLRGVLHHERNALLVPVGVAEAFADAVERLLDDRELANSLSTTARDDFANRYTVKHAAERMADFYRSCAGLR